MIIERFTVPPWPSRLATSLTAVATASGFAEATPDKIAVKKLRRDRTARQARFHATLDGEFNINFQMPRSNQKNWGHSRDKGNGVEPEIASAFPVACCRVSERIK